MYSYSSHGLVPWEVLSLLLVPWERGNIRLKCLVCPTEVQVGMYSASSHGLVLWEVLSQLLVP